MKRLKLGILTEFTANFLYQDLTEMVTIFGSKAALIILFPKPERNVSNNRLTDTHINAHDWENRPYLLVTTAKALIDLSEKNIRKKQFQVHA